MQAAGISTTIIVTMPTFGGIVNNEYYIFPTLTVPTSEGIVNSIFVLFFQWPTFEGETGKVIFK